MLLARRCKSTNTTKGISGVRFESRSVLSRTEINQTTLSVLVKKWIQNNWEELRGLWCKKSPNVAYLRGGISQQDWTNHPRFNRWKRRLECQYQARDFLVLLNNGGTEEERRAFARWAIDKGVVKLPEGVTVDGL